MAAAIPASNVAKRRSPTLAPRVQREEEGLKAGGMMNKPQKKLLRNVLVVIGLLVVVCGWQRLQSTASAASSSTMQTTGRGCAQNSDCGMDAICVGDVCMASTRECAIDTDCGAGAVCSHDGNCYHTAR
jgi:hypothetical protein